MKTPKATKLKSGKWHCRVVIDGTPFYVTRDTEKETIAEAMSLKAGIKTANKTGKTLTKAIDDYIEIRNGVLSPSTIRGYRIIQKNRFQQLMKKEIAKITDSQWKNAVNIEAKRYNAKTVRNSWGFISSVINAETGRTVPMYLPQEIPNERPFLDVEQIPVFIDAIKGTKVEIPALLALSSLRRSEIMALRWENVDLVNDELYVEASKVPTENNKMVIKNETKNRSSRRIVPISEQLHNALYACEVKEGFVYTGPTNFIYDQINKICHEHGLPLVGVHGLRHSFASLAVHVNMPEDVAMEIGGWSDNHTMKRIYTRVSKKDRNDYASEYKNYFKSL